MNARSLIFIDKLKQAIQLDARFASLMELDALIKKDEGIAALSRNMQEKGEVFAEKKSHLGLEHEETKIAQKEFLQAKLELSSHPLVASYEAQYRGITLLYFQINDILFGDFNRPLWKGERHD